MMTRTRKLACAPLLVLTLSLVAGAAVAEENALLQPAALTEQAPDVFQAEFVTTTGSFVIEVHRAWAPIGADRFYNLVKHGFFDDTGFFRVIPGFVVQFGLSGKPEVNAALREATIADDPVKQSNQRGFVTYAKTSQPNSRTTQIFINLGNNERLDGQRFAPFGKVVKGMEVVQAINAEYGQSPNQGMIVTQGNTYLKQKFPRLDFTKKATVKEK